MPLFGKPPTSRDALGAAGFTFQGSGFNGSDDRIGTVMTHHYTKTTNSVGKGGIVRPITHHIFVDEYGRYPGKYNAEYHVTQGGQPLDEGRFNTLRRHKDNFHGGVADPLDEIMGHHRRVMNTLNQAKVPPLVHMTPDNLDLIRPDRGAHAEPWGEKELATRIHRGPPRDGLVSYNSVDDTPIDPYVHRVLTGGAKGRPSFEYQGRLGPETDVYHADHEDPQDPYMRYGFTVRHMPSATASPHVYEDGTVDPVPVRPLPFSYNVTHYPIDMPDENGDHPIGDFMSIPGVEGPVANFTDLGPLIERHHNTLRSFGLMDLPPREPRPAWHFTAALLRRCPECGGNDVDFMEIYGQGPGGLHSEPTGRIGGQCNNCYSEFSPQEIPSPDSAQWSPSMDREASVQKTADDFDDIIKGNNYAGTCSNCGKAVRDIPESSFRDDKLYQLTPEDDAPDPEMHGSPVNLCGSCYVDSDMHEMAHRMPKMFGWHYPGAKPGSCPDCDRAAMDEADEDLRP